MSDRIFQNHNSFEVSGRGDSVEFDTYSKDGTMTVRCDVNAGWDSQVAYFNMTREEATALKNFLIEQGY